VNAQASPSRTPAVEGYFQLSLTLLLTVSTGALAWAGQVGPITGALSVAALAVRLRCAWRSGPSPLSRRWATAAALVIVGFYPLDLVYSAADFVDATIRMLLLFSALKLVIARTSREYFYLGLLAFLELLSASMFSAGIGYFGFLGVFLLLVVATYAAFEIRRGFEQAKGAAIGAGWTRAAAWRLSALSGVVAVSVLCLSAALFLVLPRALSRSARPLLQGDFAVGFSDEVDLGLTGSLEPDPTPVMRVESLSGGSLDKLYWRGVALHYFDGTRWSAPGVGSSALGKGGLVLPRGIARRRDEDGRRVHYRVQLEPLSTDALFLAGSPEQIRGSFRRLFLGEDDSIRLPTAGRQGQRYEAVAWLPDRSRIEASEDWEAFDDRFQAMYLQVPDFDSRVARMAIDLASGASSPLATAARYESHFRTQFGYTLDLPAARAEDPLAEFLFERRKGHCQYFASAMALMLRLQGIPSRVVNGFAGGARNPLSGLHVIRGSDAHSWVEAYIPGHGWTEFDPTPEDPGRLANPLFAQAWMLWDAIESAWFEWVLDYDVDRQVVLARSVQRGTRSTVLNLATSFERLQEGITSLIESWRAGLRESPTQALGSTAIGLLSLGGLFLLWRRAPLWLARLGGPEKAASAAASRLVARALRALARRGYARGAAQTPGELARSLPQGETRRRFEHVLRSYEAARFGGNREAERRLPTLVRELERTG